MQYHTVLIPKRERYHIRVQRGGRGFYFDDFEYELHGDPTVEAIAVQFGSDVPECLPREFWPDVEVGANVGCGRARVQEVRLCCVRFTLLTAKYHEVDTSPEAVQLSVAACVHGKVALLQTESVPPLRTDWLTSDVVALARGVQSEATIDRLPILADALQDAGCGDPLVIEHLQTCPDHAPSCWVVEMILDQAAARDAGTAG